MTMKTSIILSYIYYTCKLMPHKTRQDKYILIFHLKKIVKINYHD